MGLHSGYEGEQAADLGGEAVTPEDDVGTCFLPGCAGRPAPGQRLCPAELMAMALVCFGKQRYRHNVAVLAARKRCVPSSHYHCPVCGRWHIGRTPPDGKSSTPRAHEVRNRLRKAGLGWYIGQLAHDWDPKLSDRDAAGNWKRAMLG